MDYIDELAIKGKEGDKKAVEVLAQRLKPLIVSCACRYNRYEVEDLIQDGYVMLLECVKDYEVQRGPFLAYFKTRLKYYILNQLRKGKESLPLIEGLVSSSDEKETEMFEAMEIADLKKALMTLSPKQRDVIIRYYFKGETLSEIAKSYKKHYMSVVRLKERALDKLKKQLIK
ncbi:sigma-70 family RNA polymerase sigma factor [Caldanaerobius polysaccharolyticus]|uniref:sigma-70 family RNA polymerase sigma factor n=1 Tax=Caldanaerobius polysaccharolyticus TaxID=44256 RepID=UPI00047B5F75|nr:sigma-70 family RNA polymerase sigma factor [Caldanaerobius polysaccharolyticus]